MPELPEVETIVRDLRGKIIGNQLQQVTIYTFEVLRNDPQDFVHCLVGLSIQGIRRWGKNIIIDLSGNLNLLIHLGMTGQLLYLPSKSPLQKHTHVIFHLVPGTHQLRYRDQRRFGHIQLVNPQDLDQLPRLARLGPDPLKISLEEFTEIIISKKRHIKPLLLDQTVLAGLGNIYTDEALHRARIHPEQYASALSLQEIKQLHQTIQEVLREAIAHGGSSVDDYLRVDARSGNYQQLHRVYRRQGKPCYYCGSPIVRKKIVGRGTYFCPQCQISGP